MLTRRQFLSMAAAAPVALRVAPNYDLVIKGGRVIDPANKIDRMMDVAISGGRIAAVQPNIAAGATEMIDATGKLVVPGLIDIHTHARTKEMPSICLADGVTSLVDAGSAGADQIDEIVATAKGAPNRVRILINIARTGILGDGELLDINHADPAAARQAIERHRDVIVGIKARLSRTVAGKNDLEALRRAQSVAAPLNIPIMIHIGDTVSPLPDLLAVLKRGDIVTHVYSPPPHGIMDDAGKLLPQVAAARRRGIWFDIGNGRLSHWTWQSAEHAMQIGFLPDTISTDWTDAGRTDQVVDFGNVLSKYLLLGMPLDQVIARGTVNSAKVFPAFKDLGTLRAGATADVTILDLRDGNFEFIDNEGGKRTGRKRLFASATIFGGKRVRT